MLAQALRWLERARSGRLSHLEGDASAAFASASILLFSAIESYATPFPENGAERAQQGLSKQAELAHGSAARWSSGRLDAPKISTTPNRTFMFSLPGNR